MNNCDYCFMDNKELYEYKNSLPAGGVMHLCNKCKNRILDYEKLLPQPVTDLDYKFEYKRLLLDMEVKDEQIGRMKDIIKNLSKLL